MPLATSFVVVLFEVIYVLCLVVLPALLIPLWIRDAKMRTTDTFGPLQELRERSHQGTRSSEDAAGSTQAAGDSEAEAEAEGDSAEAETASDSPERPSRSRGPVEEAFARMSKEGSGSEQAEAESDSAEAKAESDAPEPEEGRDSRARSSRSPTPVEEAFSRLGNEES